MTKNSFPLASVSLVAIWSDAVGGRGFTLRWTNGDLGTGEVTVNESPTGELTCDSGDLSPEEVRRVFNCWLAAAEPEGVMSAGD